jgi:lambda family phage portal protein
MIAQFCAGVGRWFSEAWTLRPDLLDTSLTSSGQNQVVEGVEYSQIGQVVAYHLYDHHPGDLTWWSRRQLQSRRVPADDILHIYRADRPGQMRGVPWLAPVMLTLGEISDYQEAQILKQRMAALLAGVVESEDEASVFQGSGLESLAPGAIVGLKPGQKINWTQPPAVDDYENFMRSALQAVAMGIGVTFEALAGDLRGVNFSSGRMGRMEMDRLVEQWQQFVMIQQFCAGVARWFTEAWGLDPSLPKGAFEIRWTAPRRPLIDPNKEILAMRDEVEAGFSSLQRQQRRLGHDPDEIARERAEDEARGAMPAPPETSVEDDTAGDDKTAGKEDDDERD